MHKRRQRRFRFVRRSGRRYEVNRIEVESFLRRFGHRNVARVDRVERAAKKRNGPPVAMSVRFLRRV